MSGIPGISGYSGISDSFRIARIAWIARIVWIARIYPETPEPLDTPETLVPRNIWNLQNIRLTRKSQKYQSPLGKHSFPKTQNTIFRKR